MNNNEHRDSDNKILISSSSDTWPEFGSMTFMVILVLIIGGISILFPIMSVKLHILINSVQVLTFNTPLPPFISFVYNCQSDTQEMIHHHGLDSHLLEDKWCWHLLLISFFRLYCNWLLFPIPFCPTNLPYTLPCYPSNSFLLFLLLIFTCVYS